MRKVLALLFSMTLLSAFFGCASREKGRAVSVTPAEVVAPCQLLGRVTGGEPAESETAEEPRPAVTRAAMRLQAATSGPTRS